jgi:PEP-CTERM motif
MTKFSRAVLGAALLAVSGLAAATTTTGIVDAAGNSLGGGTAFDTGVFLTAGESFSVSANPADLWDNSWTDPTYLSNANGHTNQQGTLDGLFDNFGALVGEIGSGPLFNVGTSLDATAAGTGELKLFYFDSDAYNNTGSVHVEVSAVPEPGNIVLMGLALGAFALTRRRKA